MLFKPKKYWLISALALMALSPALLNAQTLRVGLAEDPDVLDPTLARSFVGRIVFSALCDKLFDIDEKLNILPQLAASYEWSADSKALKSSTQQQSSSILSATKTWPAPTAVVNWLQSPALTSLTLLQCD